MRLATWNVNSLTARLPRVTEWIEAQRARRALHAGDQADRRRLPDGRLRRPGLRVGAPRDGRWNGVADREPGGPRRARVAGSGATRTSSGHPARGRRAVAGVGVHSVYVPNGRSLDSEHYAGKLAWLAPPAPATSSETCDPAGQVAVCGDFNVAPDDRDVWDPDQFVGATHVSEPERRRPGQDIVDWGLEDVFRRRAPRREDLLVVGLPGRRLPRGPGPADRPGAAAADHSPSGDAGGAGRPRRPQGQEALRPRPGGGRRRRGVDGSPPGSP